MESCIYLLVNVAYLFLCIRLGIPVFYIIMSMDILGSEKAVKMVNNLDVHVLG